MLHHPPKTWLGMLHREPIDAMQPSIKTHVPSQPRAEAMSIVKMCDLGHLNCHHLPANGRC